ncbi:MAG: hypothetical protein WDM87_03885 [Terracidiphilus sp.]
MQLLFEIGTLRGATGNPNSACSIDSGKLSDEGTDGSAGSRDHNGVAFLRLADCFHSGVGREARHAQNSQPRCYRQRVLIDPAYSFSGRNDMRSPTGAGENNVSLREVEMI